jgi:hypothetical protein
MIFRQLGRNEARHRRLAAQGQHAPRRLTDGAHRAGQSKRHASRHGPFAERDQQLVDPAPEEHRLVIGDKIRAPRRLPAASGQRALGREVGVDGILDVHHVDPICAVAHDAELARPRPGQHPGHKVRITHTPDQMGPQGHGAQPLLVRSQHVPLRHRLGQGIGARTRLRQRQRFVRPRQRLAVVHHAR